jgi:hypothetical protein
LRILDCQPVPGSDLYTIVCNCGFPFRTEGDYRGGVKCPKCKKPADLRTLIKAWKATPTEKLARLRELADKAKELYGQWMDLPELKRDRGAGKELAEKLEACYQETKEIMASLEPEKEKEPAPSS